jgi:plasmid stability protein
MAQLTVRNVDDAIAAALKARAKRAGRSAEAEHRRILEEALRPKPEEDFFEKARRLAVRLPPGSPSSTELIREGRDRNDYWSDRDSDRGDA